MATRAQTDERLLRRAFELARRARERGDEPFGAVIASPDGQIWIEAGNTIHSSDDPTAHAEVNALRQAAGLEDPGRCTLYASTEPCPMCATAQVWARVGRLVYGLSTGRLAQLVDAATQDGPTIRLGCRALLSHARPSIEIVGPLLEDEAEAVHDGYWGARPT